MKLTKTTEWTVLAVLAAYIAFMPRMGAVRNFLSTGVGRLIALLVIVYVWKYVSALIAVLLVVAFVRCTTSVWEGLVGGDEEVQGKAKSATCPADFEFDVTLQMCKGTTEKNKSAMVKPSQVVCESGYKPNEAGDKCVKIQSAPAPPPPPPPAPPTPPPASSTGSASAEAAAPVTKTEPFASGRGTVATTPGEAQALAGGTVVLQQQGGTEPFCGAGPGYPLQ